MVAKKKNIIRKRSRPIEPKKSFLNMKLIGILLILIIIIISVYFIFISFNTNDENNENPIALIDTNKGIIQVELFKDKVPNTCENFIKLANDNFYDGLVFHRVIDNFVIQGGGFDSSGASKESPYGPIDLEIPKKDGELLVKHVDGAISMARTSDPNSATSQFFINDGVQSQLEPGGVDPNGYAAFGVVIDGIDIVRSIAEVETTTKNGMQNWPVNDVIINSITIEYY